MHPITCSCVFEWNEKLKEYLIKYPCEYVEERTTYKDIVILERLK